MDTRSLLSRRSMLKASSFFASALAIAPAVVAAPSVPEVLTVLLTEYADASRLVGQTHVRFQAARTVRAKAIENARLFFVWPDGDLGRLGEAGSSYHPDYAMTLLQRLRTKALAACDGDSEARAKVRKAYASTARRLRSLRPRYEAAAASTDWEAATEADTVAYARFTDARDAVRAYRPHTMAEVAAIIRCISKVGPYPGTHSGISVREIAEMLDGGLA